MIELQIGKTYKVKHSRKGDFQIKVTDIDSEWVTGNIVTGKVKLISSIIDNQVENGEEITIRKSLCRFVPLD